MSTFPPITHVALTVRDLEVSQPWYTALLGAEPVLDEDTGPFRHVVWRIGATLLGLHEFPDGDASMAFDERRPGLDHVAFACADRHVLDSWRARLDELGIAHGGIVDASYGSGLSFRDPDGLPLELFARPRSTSPADAGAAAARQWRRAATPRAGDDDRRDRPVLRDDRHRPAAGVRHGLAQPSAAELGAAGGAGVLREPRAGLPARALRPRRMRPVGAIDAAAVDGRRARAAGRRRRDPRPGTVRPDRHVDGRTGRGGVGRSAPGRPSGGWCSTAAG